MTERVMLNVKEEVKERLKGYKLCPDESMNSLMIRFMDDRDKVIRDNTLPNDDWPGVKD